MVTYNLANAGSDSLYRYLCSCIKNDIVSGVLKPGERLPSKRVFASNLGVSVITVENAYSQLIEEGYIYSMPKRGYYVADFSALSAGKNTGSDLASAPLNDDTSGLIADFSSNQTESDLFPFTIWSKVIREILSDSRTQLMTNSPCGGSLALRRSIAGYLRDFRGMSVSTEQIIVGAGTEYLYGLLIQLLGSDRIYGLENPGYKKLERIYSSNRVDFCHINMDESGISVSELEKNNVHIVHITPSHQFPTGIVMPISRRYELLGWASRRTDRYIIEDDYDSELRLSGKPIPTLQSIDMSDKVIYMNTFTKTLCSTVRISYMVLPQSLAKQFYERLSFYSCTVSNFEQYTMARFIDEGKFELHVNRLRSYYRKKRNLLLDSIQKTHLNDISSVSGADAGLHFLMDIDTPLSECEVLDRTKQEGIKLVPLSHYYKGENSPQNVYVMNYSSVDMNKSDEIAQRLSHAICGV